MAASRTTSDKAGVADRRGYYGFAAAWCDLDDDGKLDLLVANDSTPNYLYTNKGDGTFEDVSYVFRVRSKRERQRASLHGVGRR